MYKKEAEMRLKEYQKAMEEEELSPRTIRKYAADIKRWLNLQGDIIESADMIKYKDNLMKSYAARSVNSKLIPVNRYLKWLGYSELTVKTRHIQGCGSLENVISKNEYIKMLDFAKRTSRWKMYYIMRTIALTGIRISELQYITVEAVEAGSAEIYSKGKYRRIYIPHKLADELISYCKKKEIKKGYVFPGKKEEKCISSVAVWKNMKYIAGRVDVAKENVYPHSLRHLFAKTYMHEIGDITELSDLLGHSRLETTWIYTKTTGAEKRQRLNRISL